MLYRREMGALCASLLFCLLLSLCRKITKKDRGCIFSSGQYCYRKSQCRIRSKSV